MAYFLDTAEDDELSEEFYRLVEVGIVVVNVFHAMKGTMVVVSSREDFEYTCSMVQWYARVRHIGTIVTVNMDRWADRGQLTFLIAG